MKNNKKTTHDKRHAARGGNPISYSVQSGTARFGLKTESGADTFVSTVAGSVGFAATGYSINPGIAGRNLALSLEAQKYDQYEFEELRFRFVRSRAITTTPGMLGLAMDPNPNAADPATLSRFNAYEIRGMDSVYEGVDLYVPKSALQGWKFVRCGPNGTDLTVYDVGRLIVATQDEDDTSKIGFVEMHYRIKFRHYHLEPSVPIPYSMSMYTNVEATDITGSFTVPWGTVVVNGLNLANSDGSITLPCGQFIIQGFLRIADDMAAFTGSATVRLNGQVSSQAFAESGNVGTSYGVALPFLDYVTSDGTGIVLIQAGTSSASSDLPAGQCKLMITALT